MRRRLLAAAALLVFLAWPVRGQSGGFRFAWLSDTHVGAPAAAEDLRASVRDINSLDGIGFVIVSGDVTEFGSHEQFVEAQTILGELRPPCHVIPGNHDCKWSESGATEFARLWGSDRFIFDAGGCCFIGLHQGPVMKMGDGHFAPQDIRWLERALAARPAGQPVIFVTHYPLDNQIDNWYAVLDELKRVNTQAVLVGHGHRNEALNFEGVPAAMGRANLRARAKVGGYTLAEVRDGAMTLVERTPGVGTKAPWDTIRLEKHDYAALTNHWARPDFSVNGDYPTVKNVWQFDGDATAAASPAVEGRRVFFGDGSGKMRALDLKTGAVEWESATQGPIYSTPDTAGPRVVFGSTDGSLYALAAKNGKELWRFQTGKPVVASPRVTNNIVYVGASDGHFRALNAKTGRLVWDFPGVGGFVETRPLVCDGKVIFGAWDLYLYALDARTGKLLWKWKGASPGDLGRMYSPAAFWPVAAHGKVFVVAPDRCMTAVDLESGGEIWRSALWPVRESIGLAPDQSRFYVRTMPGIIAAFSTESPRPSELWQLDAHFGYDINSAMLEEQSGVLFYGTKNGLLLAIDSKTGRLQWEHKLGVTVLNTVVPLNRGRDVLVSDVDGKVTLVESR